MTLQTQSIDISPEKVATIATAAIRFLNLETTLMPGSIRAQLAVLEVYLSGLASGQLVLAPTPVTPVESEAKPDDSPTGNDDDGGT